MTIKCVNDYDKGSRLFLVNNINKVINADIEVISPFVDDKNSFLESSLSVGRNGNIDIFIYIDNPADICDYKLNQIYNKAIASVSSIDDKKLVFSPCVLIENIDMAKQIFMLAEAVSLHNYSFIASNTKNIELSILFESNDLLKKYKEHVEYSNSVVEAQNTMRRLGDTPPNICNPDYILAEAKQLSKKYRLKIDVISGDKIRKAQMGAFWSVAQGSASTAHLITLHYNNAPTRNASPVVLVGKGITFDTGGHSLKPGAAMIGMKYDMCGAATCLAVMQAVCELDLKINLKIVIPTCENMPGPTASRPDDVVTSLSGKTIEILNTDAEGRLILCDALTHAEQFKPKCVIDIATLTGAVIVALGPHRMGLFANDNNLAKALLTAGESVGDKAWQLPLAAEYTAMLKSKYADLSNIPTNGAGAAGTVTAASFLAEFTKNYKWAHLDIAGVAFKSPADKGATGKAVPLLVQFLNNIS